LFPLFVKYANGGAGEQRPHGKALVWDVGDCSSRLLPGAAAPGD